MPNVASMFSESKIKFNLRLARDREWAKAVGLKARSADEPKQGPFYWVFQSASTMPTSLSNVKGFQVLKAMTFPLGSVENIDHPDFWNLIVDLHIAKLYKIKNAETIRELKNVPYAMPRGRVVLTDHKIFIPKACSSKKLVCVYFGARELTGSQKKQIIDAFGLTSLFIEGLVMFAGDFHERSLKNDEIRYKSLVGECLTSS